MKEPNYSECINEMHKSVNIPVTVKCRIGVDDMDKESELDRFVEEVSSSDAILYCPCKKSMAERIKSERK